MSQRFLGCCNDPPAKSCSLFVGLVENTFVSKKLKSKDPAQQQSSFLHILHSQPVAVQALQLPLGPAGLEMVQAILAGKGKVIAVEGQHWDIAPVGRGHLRHTPHSQQGVGGKHRHQRPAAKTDGVEDGGHVLQAVRIQEDLAVGVAAQGERHKPAERAGAGLVMAKEHVELLRRVHRREGAHARKAGARGQSYEAHGNEDGQQASCILIVDDEQGTN